MLLNYDLFVRVSEEFVLLLVGAVRHSSLIFIEILAFKEELEFGDYVRAVIWPHALILLRSLVLFDED